MPPQEAMKSPISISFMSGLAGEWSLASMSTVPFCRRPQPEDYVIREAHDSCASCRWYSSSTHGSCMDTGAVRWHTVASSMVSGQCVLAQHVACGVWQTGGCLGA